ncbi:Uncharacterised protein [Halioglobus japonicus]|nr:Uncharacterised protein [Halioglobus japonicus]
MGKPANKQAGKKNLVSPHFYATIDWDGDLIDNSDQARFLSAPK